MLYLEKSVLKWQQIQNRHDLIENEQFHMGQMDKKIGVLKFITGIGNSLLYINSWKMSYHGCKTEMQGNNKEFSPLDFEEPSEEFNLVKDQSYFGQWQEKETLQYFIFIHHHLDKFATKSSRKSLKIFKQMSKFIPTRNSSQCRTHHQNNILKFSTLQASIQEYTRFNPKFPQIYEENKDKLAYFEDMEFCQDTSTVFKNQERGNFMSPKNKQSGQISDKKTNSSENLINPQKMHSFQQILSHTLVEKEWEDCQQLFNKWIQKLAILMQINTPLIPNF